MHAALNGHEEDTQIRVPLKFKMRFVCSPSLLCCGDLGLFVPVVLTDIQSTCDATVSEGRLTHLSENTVRGILSEH